MARWWRGAASSGTATPSSGPAARWTSWSGGPGRPRRQLDADIADLEPLAPPRGRPEPEDADLPLARTQGGVLVHIYEELAQHRGQMEVTRDVLRATWARSSGSAAG